MREAERGSLCITSIHPDSGTELLVTIIYHLAKEDGALGMRHGMYSATVMDTEADKLIEAHTGAISHYPFPDSDDRDEEHFDWEFYTYEHPEKEDGVLAGLLRDIDTHTCVGEDIGLDEEIMEHLSMWILEGRFAD